MQNGLVARAQEENLLNWPTFTLAERLSIKIPLPICLVC